MRLPLLIAATTGATIVACGRTPTEPPVGAVNFMIVAPLCSSVVPMFFRIDGGTTSVDTFRVNIGGGTHTVTRDYVLTPGPHVLSARTSWGYVWADTTVTVVANKTTTDSLPLYCS
jgi:hypothetical protein